jgi:hypothetical protein
MCDSPDIIHAALVSAAGMQLQILAVGDAVVTVSDKSGHILELQIHVDYDRRTRVIHREVVVRGDLTDEEMEVIRAEALPTIPVKAGGGYLFFPYTWADSGTVMIYPDEFGTNGVESLFEMKRVPWVSPDGMEGQSPACCISINGEERTFLVILQIGYYSFCEDLTDRFKSGYPKLEQVYTMQVIEQRTYR